jgi:hypothetical protein
MWTEFIVIGGWIFWLGVFSTSLMIISFSENEKPAWPFIPILGFLIILAVASPFSPFTWVVAHPLETLLGFLSYLILGAIWTIVKWYSFSIRAMEIYQKHRNKWLSDRNIDVFINSMHGVDLKTYISRNVSYDRFGGTMPPEPGRNINRIFTWMLYWPWSLLWTFLNDPLVRIFNFAFRRIEDLLKSVTRRRFKKFEEFE